MPDVTIVDETQGGVPVEDKAAVKTKKQDSTFLESEIKTLRSANDSLRTDKQKALDAAAVEAARVAQEASDNKSEAEKLKTRLDTRAAEDKVELGEIVSGMEETAKNAVTALPEAMSDYDKLKYIKGNKDLFFKPTSTAKVFSQPTGQGAGPEATDYTPASTQSLIRGGPKAIAAEQERIRKTYGG